MKKIKNKWAKAERRPAYTIAGITIHNEMRSANQFREMANRINALPHGMALIISAQELDDLPSLPLWAFQSEITMGFERVKEYVLGSSHPDLWSFIRNRDGSITVYRKIQKTIDRPIKRVVF